VSVTLRVKERPQNDSPIKPNQSPSNVQERVKKSADIRQIDRKKVLRETSEIIRLDNFRPPSLEELSPLLFFPYDERKTRSLLKKERKMKAVEILRADHRTVMEFIHRLRATGKRNAILLQQVYDSFKVHTRCEEQIFYPAMREIGHTEVQQSVEEHHEMDHLLEELMVIRIQKGAEVFLEELGAFEQMIQEHVEDEEELLFSAAEDQLKDKLEEMGDQIERLKIDLRTSRYGMAA
jgi:hemerythrin-like domain-containing protein